MIALLDTRGKPDLCKVYKVYMNCHIVVYLLHLRSILMSLHITNIQSYIKYCIVDVIINHCIVDAIIINRFERMFNPASISFMYFLLIYIDIYKTKNFPISSSGLCRPST